MRYPPIQRFSSTVMSGNTELSCSTYATPACFSFWFGERWVVSRPSTRMLPARMRVNP